MFFKKFVVLKRTAYLNSVTQTSIRYQRWFSLRRDCLLERSPTYQMSPRTFYRSYLPVAAIYNPHHRTKSLFFSLRWICHIYCWQGKRRSACLANPAGNLSHTSLISFSPWNKFSRSISWISAWRIEFAKNTCDEPMIAIKSLLTSSTYFTTLVYHF